jgi:small subunit ribosomal protein S4e
MVKNHLKRLRMPNTWPIAKKTNTWVTKPNPGPHKIKDSMPINVVLRDILGYANTTKEVKKIINDSGILIDKVVRKDHKFPVGIFDIVEIPKIKENYIMILNKKGKLSLQKIKDPNKKYAKIVGKKILKKNKLQINLHNGNNFFSDKNEYKVNDTLVIDLKTRNILKALKFEKGAHAFIISGKYAGNSGEIENIKEKQIEVKINKDTIKVPKDYVFIVEKDFMKDE